MPTNAWDRWAGEPEDGHAAFLTFRDMAAPRSVVGAFRQRSGKDRAKQADGNWNRWARKYEWEARALAWDNRLASARQRGIERVASDEAEQWERRRQKQLRDDFELSLILRRKAKELARFPVTLVKSEDGRTIVMPISPRDLKDVASIAKDAQAMAWAAINQALPPDDDDFDPETASVEECRAYMERKARRRKAPAG